MVIGGSWGDTFASAEVLAADGSGWSALAPMGTKREDFAAAVLPRGEVLVAGGDDSRAELWDPATGAWSDLPPMAEERFAARCCVLPSGRVAVVGGEDDEQRNRNDAEVFDPEAGTWDALPPMSHGRYSHGVVAAGGGHLGRWRTG